MQESKFLKIIIAVLVTLNLSVLGFLMFGHGPGGGPPPGEGRGPDRENAAHYLHRALALSDAQEDAYGKMRREHHAAVEDIRDRMRTEKRALYGLLQERDTAAIRPRAAALIDSLAACSRDIERITFEHFAALRRICTTEQQRAFDKVIGEALDRMR